MDFACADAVYRAIGETDATISARVNLDGGNCKSFGALLSVFDREGCFNNEDIVEGTHLARVYTRRGNI